MVNNAAGDPRNQLDAWLLGAARSGAFGGSGFARSNTDNSTPIANSAAAEVFDETVTLPANTLQVGSVIEVNGVFRVSADGSGGTAQELAGLAAVFTPSGSPTPTAGVATDSGTVLAAALSTIASALMARSIRMVVTEGNGPGDRGLEAVASSGAWLGVQDPASIVTIPSGLDETVDNEVGWQWEFDNALPGNTAFQQAVAVTAVTPTP